MRRSSDDFLDPREPATIGKISSMIRELRAFDGERAAEALEAVAEMMRADRTEEDRRLRAELIRSVPASRVIDLPAGLDPEDIRTELFRTAWEMHFVAGEEGDLFSAGRNDVLLAAASGLHLDPELLIEAMFADTPGEHRLAFTPEEAADAPLEALRSINRERLRRLLRGALGLTLRVPARGDGSASWVPLLWGAKRLGLMIEPIDAGGSLLLRIEGPHALFARTTMYGNRLFDFALLVLRHAGRDWSLRADLVARDARRDGTIRDITLDAASIPFFANEQAGPGEMLRSEDEEAFRKYFTKHAPDAELVYEGALIPLADGKRKSFMVPDFVIRAPDAPAEILVEIVGFWRKEYLQKKLEKIRLLGNRRLALFVNATLSVTREELEAPDFDRVRVYFYSGREELKQAVKTFASELRVPDSAVARHPPLS